MPFEKLHKNSGKSKKEFCLGKLFLYWTFAEDPAGRVWVRQSEDNMKRTTHLFALNIVEKENEDGTRQKALNVILGMLNLYAAWLAS